MPIDFTVTLFGESTIRVSSVVAETPEEAFKLASDIVSLADLRHKLQHDNPADKILWTEFDGDNSGGIVDFPNDDDYDRTVTINTYGRIVAFVPMGCSTYPELNEADKHLETVKKDLGDDWLVRRLAAAQEEIREVAAVIKLRENENRKN